MIHSTSEYIFAAKTCLPNTTSLEVTRWPLRNTWLPLSNISAQTFPPVRLFMSSAETTLNGRDRTFRWSTETVLWQSLRIEPLIGIWLFWRRAIIRSSQWERTDG